MKCGFVGREEHFGKTLNFSNLRNEDKLAFSVNGLDLILTIFNTAIWIVFGSTIFSFLFVISTSNRQLGKSDSIYHLRIKRLKQNQQNKR